MGDDLRELMSEQARLRKIVDEWLEVIALPADGSEIVIPRRTREQTLAFLDASDALH